MSEVAGMTDKQFKAYLRGLINQLERALNTQDWELIQKLKAELQQSLED